MLLVCGLLELGARLAQPWLESHVSFYYYRSILKALVLKNPELIWMGRPAAKALIRNPLGELIPYQQNSLGWRDEEFQLLRSPFNALVLGDSFSFGAGVRAEDRFSERLEKMFSGLDVWNLGVMGYAPDQELLLAQIGRAHV